MFIINTFSTSFGHHYAHLQETKTCVTALHVVPAFQELDRLLIFLSITQIHLEQLPSVLH